MDQPDDGSCRGGFRSKTVYFASIFQTTRINSNPNGLKCGLPISGALIQGRSLQIPLYVPAPNLRILQMCQKCGVAEAAARAHVSSCVSDPHYINFEQFCCVVSKCAGGGPTNDEICNAMFGVRNETINLAISTNASGDRLKLKVAA